MKKRAILGILALVLVLAFGGGVMAAKSVMDSTEEGIIVDGVYAGSINLSGLTAKEAEKAVEDYISELEEKTVTMVTGDHEDKLKLSSIGIDWTNPEILDEAMELGKSGNLIERFKALSDLKRENHVYDLKLEVDQKAIKKYIKKTLQAYDQEAKEPELKRSGGEFVITKEENGLTVDVDATIASINELLAKEWDSDQATVETTVVVAEPKHKASELEKVKDLLGSRTTTYDSGNRGRTQSLELSTSRLDGTIIWPGETISVSLLMGERSQEGGYGTGQGYFGTDVEETVGAGICQTASTLYNAALYAELDIVERYHHTLIVHYVDYAMDSTIYAGDDYKNPQKDLKLKNPYDDPVYIEASAGGGYCTFRVYGNETRPENREVKYVSKTLSETYPTGVTYTDDPTKPVGYESTTQGAFPAVKATLTKEVYVDGKLTESTLLYTDSYSGSNRKAVRGTKQPVATTKAPETTAAATSDPAASSETTGSASSAAESTNAPETTPAETTNAPETTKAPEQSQAESSPAE
ncbi:MAG: VanW family protein [Lachnospiraceae bacterium]|nr:VanW family protein [Lachnospiraceae bacterium]MDY4970344.1 VanW family protein [Lachnospiraceae bacterium]